jgi:hypothetical protein
MRRALWACFALATISVVSLSFETSCKHIGPVDRCSGKSVNRRFVPGTTTPEDVCTECIEATCCDLIGDCQGTDCANEVAQTHACVEDAGRAASIEEPACRVQFLKGTRSESVYQCMRDNCDDECQLPTCRLDPLVPPLGDLECDRCFAQGCCSLMNECAKNRTCLLALSCIVDECRDQFSSELGAAALDAVTARKNFICDGGVPPNGAGEGGPGFDGVGGGCFRSCIEKSFVPKNEESSQASCLAAKINECGAAVDCGKHCVVRRDAAADSAPAPSDAGADAADDGPSDAGAD